jgi:hypothetical protein
VLCIAGAADDEYSKDTAQQAKKVDYIDKPQTASLHTSGTTLAETVET